MVHIVPKVISVISLVKVLQELGPWKLQMVMNRDEGELLSWTLLIDVLNSDEINIDDEPQVF